MLAVALSGKEGRIGEMKNILVFIVGWLPLLLGCVPEKSSCGLDQPQCQPSSMSKVMEFRVVSNNTNSAFTSQHVEELLISDSDQLGAPAKFFIHEAAAEEWVGYEWQLVPNEGSIEHRRSERIMDGYSVYVELCAYGIQKGKAITFAKFTKGVSGERVAISVNGKFLSSPIFEGELPPRFSLRSPHHGQYDEESATKLAAELLEVSSDTGNTNDDFKQDHEQTASDVVFYHSGAVFPDSELTASLKSPGGGIYEIEIIDTRMGSHVVREVQEWELEMKEPDPFYNYVQEVIPQVPPGNYQFNVTAKDGRVLAHIPNIEVEQGEYVYPKPIRKVELVEPDVLILSFSNEKNESQRFTGFPTRAIRVVQKVGEEYLECTRRIIEPQAIRIPKSYATSDHWLLLTGFRPINLGGRKDQDLIPLVHAPGIALDRATPEDWPEEVAYWPKFSLQSDDDGLASQQLRNFILKPSEDGELLLYVPKEGRYGLTWLIVDNEIGEIDNLHILEQMEGQAVELRHTDPVQILQLIPPQSVIAKAIELAAVVRIERENAPIPVIEMKAVLPPPPDWERP